MVLKKQDKNKGSGYILSKGNVLLILFYCMALHIHTYIYTYIKNFKKYENAMETVLVDEQMVQRTVKKQQKQKQVNG